ncbi:growth-regulating factor 3-like [Solanum verrucosum]|uniref:growth-regulating factor 3-like n=1 Tax=Solanum verrucosum TaxID=315347 RepID=UPI0020D190BD|nr:growth-regulating factor 3-like [Solanum verrucosum]
MDFNLKQWSNQHESENQESPAKLPRLHLDFHSVSSDSASAAAAALPLFVSEPTTSTTTCTKLMSDSTTTVTTKFPRIGSGGGYFSLAQWQELELQSLIFRHFVAGAPVPSELLHLVKKSIIASSPPPPSYYFAHPFQQYPHYQQALMQSGYWGRAAMDPEPGRCRRTDGKKWRCSRDVVAGQKYCERHVHRGRSRSRKPVEIPTPANSGSKNNNNNNTVSHHQAFGKMVGHAHAGAGAPQFSLSGHSPSTNAPFHLNQRPIKGPPQEVLQKDVSIGDVKSSSGQILRHFFDDWPRQQQLQEGDNAATSLSISMPGGGGNPSSDFSLKLSTGNDYDSGTQVSNVEQSTWGTSHHQVASMGGPLAEALRSSTTNSSPTSVLHQLARGTTSEASYIST